MLTPPAGFEDYCRRIGPRLIAALSLYCGRREVAEELAQETLVRVWERWETADVVGSGDGWAYRVAFNLATSWVRRQAAERRAQRRVGRGVEVAEAEPADALAVRQALSDLPARQRAAVVLRYFVGFSVAETASAMSCAAGTVRALTSQGLAALRVALGEPELEEANADA